MLADNLVHTFLNEPLNFSLNDFTKDLREFLTDGKFPSVDKIVQSVEHDWPIIKTMGRLADTLAWQIEPHAESLDGVLTWLEKYHSRKKADREAALRVAQLEAAIVALRVLVHASNQPALTQEAARIVRKAGM